LTHALGSSKPTLIKIIKVIDTFELVASRNDLMHNDTTVWVHLRLTSRRADPHRDQCSSPTHNDFGGTETSQWIHITQYNQLLRETTPNFAVKAIMRF